jgi:hypothetical protein
MIPLLSCVAIVGASVLSVQQPPRLDPGSIQVFIVDESRTEGRKPPGWEGRVLAAQDLANALGQKDSPFRLVKRREEASLVLEITDRFPKVGPSAAAAARTSTVPLAHTVAFDEWNVEAIASSGSLKTRFVGSGKTSFKEAAEVLAREIDTWSRANADRLAPGRPLK